jgi:hypothetical protein
MEVTKGKSPEGEDAEFLEIEVDSS